ncbi:NXPE family member 3-like isoform X2 [Triplophysa rosa]|uniref:NXPE family member 3-like n=2 Tax=Triplophysa rosa TaxID=992332 RepID=A0A9W8C6J7_TRIRA|nr:NXPE family member 3-like isoform X2 [Triplophysa rosa]XP_057191719.1 NXPE family member 3-like isoform X2 [Triplophysa rosa]XP_057191720.1 NXPE family member 3-like isoform X2 [Triplophysa rosa]XP_057191721.1 NXPE family member 3-like isoform X2 [Triplophysa rosa]KAI7808587.1 putative NXPE family member 3-like [Triplophysa rosa]
MEIENQQYIHRKNLSLKMLIGMCLGILCYLIYWSYMESERERQPPYIFLAQHFAKLHAINTSTSPAENVLKNSSMESDSPKSSFNPESGINSENDFKSQQARPDGLITNVSMSTSPAYSTFIIQNLKDSYQIGEELCVTIHARDFNNKSKCYGGDFFQAKLFSSKNPQKASVFGEVMDLSNGSYSVCFLLPWVGRAQVAVRLIHSSEAVEVLKRHRETDSDRVFFNGYFEGPAPDGARLRETVKCNVKWDKNGLERMGSGDCCCEYKDSRTGEEWQCQRPKILPCSARVYHSMGGYIDRLTGKEAILLSKPNQDINPGEKSIINIAHSKRNVTDERKKCRPGLLTPVPSGFYLDDVWTSFVCSTRHFTPQTTTQCLKDKQIYMMGDSTMRQWFDFLLKTVPTLKQMDLHVPYQTGPLLAVDVENNIFLHWRSHGVPLRCLKTEVANLHYISNEIDDLAGGPRTVIAFNLGVHFTTFPLDIFTHRVLRIRKAVLDLLQRAPETTVIIKTVNTGFKDAFSSDWYSLQLDRILRQAFQDVGVYILDVWQMTSCHYNKDNIHPGPIIIKNEIDVFLSFICPD